MLLNYLGAIIKYWWTLAFGILGSAPWWLKLLSPQLNEIIDKYLTPITWKYIGIGCLVISFIAANYLAWRDQKQETIQIQNQNIELSAKLNALSKPHLTGQILQYVPGATENGTPTLLVYLSITNSGSPSVVESWHLSINNAKINLSEVMPTAIPHITLNTGRTIDQADAIYEKTMVPLKQGDMVRGWLMFVFNNIKQTEIYQPGTSFIVSFKDYLGNIYSTMPEVITENPRIENNVYYPGTRMPHQKKPK